ncbi:MAG: hypothetical protein AB9Q19_12560 [Candidatus Reddybacter sp.]
MTIWFVDSVLGDNANSGLVYTAPKKYLWESDGTPGLLLGATAPAAGDNVFVLTGYDEPQTVSISMAGVGSAIDEEPINIISVASFNSGSPNTLGAARSCYVGGTSYQSGFDIYLAGGFYFYGFHFEPRDEITCSNADGTLVLEGCKLQSTRAGATRNINLGMGAGQLFRYIDCRFENVTALNAGMTVEGARVELIGGGFDSTMSKAFKSVVNGAHVYLDGVDMSNVDGLAPDGVGGANESIVLHAKNCVVKSGFTYPTLTRASHTVLATNNKTAAGSNSEYSAQSMGIVQSETTNVRTGDAKVDGVGYAYEMLPNTDVAKHNPLRCLTITGRADFSTAKTVDIYIANTTRDLDDLEINFDLSYPTYNQGGNTIKNCKGANWLVAPTTHADDTGSTWGGSPTYMQKMSVTVGGATEGREGPFQIVVWLAVDVDVFVDPYPVVS